MRYTSTEHDKCPYGQTRSKIYKENYNNHNNVYIGTNACSNCQYYISYEHIKKNWYVLHCKKEKHDKIKEILK